MWKEICTYALKHQELFFRNSQNKAINYEEYDKDILKICSNDFQFSKYLGDNLSGSQFELRESNIYYNLFVKKEERNSIKVLQSLATDYVGGYMNDKIPFVQSRKTLFEALGNSDNIKVSIQDILSEPTPDIINETTIQTLINRFRRIYLMRRLLFFSYLQASIAILESDKNNQEINTQNFYHKFSNHISKDQDYLFLNLTDEKSKAPQTTTWEHSVTDSYSNIDDVNDLKKVLESIQESLSKDGDASKEIKDKVDELSKKTDAFKAKYIKESLSEKWKKGSFLSDRDVAKKALNENASEIAKSLSDEIGQGFGNLITGRTPSIKDGDFWKHVGRSVGPMIFGVLGTALGGPIGGSLLGGIGKSIFGAILGDEPDPLSAKLDQEFDDLKKQLDEQFSLVDGKLDKLSADLNKLFAETQKEIRDTNQYIENLFKDWENFGTDNAVIKQQAKGLKEDMNDIHRYYTEIIFRTKGDSIPQIEEGAKKIIGMEERILSKLDTIVKELYSREYSLSANKINIPNSLGDDSSIKKFIGDHAKDKDPRRFDATIDSLLTPLNVVEDLYSYYYQKRKFLFASQAALFIFHWNKINYVDVLSSLKAMYYAQDSINAALLLHPSLLKTNTIGQRNLEFYSLVQACRRVKNPNGLQSFGLMIDPKDKYDFNTRVFLKKPQGYSLQFGYEQLGNYILIIPDNSSGNYPFNLKFWQGGVSLGEAKIQICLGTDDTLTLFDGDNKLGKSIHFVNRLSTQGWTEQFPNGVTRYVRNLHSQAETPSSFEFDFRSFELYPYLKIVITKSNDFKDKIEISSIVSIGDSQSVPPKMKMIRSFEANYQKVWEQRAKLSPNIRINLDMRYQLGEGIITLWYSFTGLEAADERLFKDSEIKVEDGKIGININEIDVNNLLEGFPYPGF